MRIFALFTWVATAFAGLYLLAVWLIEYDIGGPGGAVSRLPRTVVSGHLLLAASGLAGHEMPSCRIAGVAQVHAMHL